MIKAIGFLAGGLAVFGGLLVLLSAPAPQTRVQLDVPSRSMPAPQQVVSVAAAAETIAAAALEQAQPARSDARGQAALPVAGGDAATPATRGAATAAAADAIDEIALVEDMFANREHLPEGTPVDHTADPVPATVMPAGGAAEDSAMTGNVAAGSEAAGHPAPDAGTAAEAVEAGTDRQWFAVWDPFHSEWSANAFARRLETLTGLDYRVVRSGPAQYEVAVGFDDEPERIANLAAIEEATGLRIAGGSL